MPEKTNCHLRCRYGRICFRKGEDREDFPDECVEFYHIDDMLMDARDILEEQRKSRGEDFE
jgi:hypothetical protein